MEFLFSFLFLTFLLCFAYAGISMAPWVPIKKRDLEVFLGQISIQPGEKFLEIGAGDGRVCNAVAKKYPNNIVVGYELNPLMYLISLVRKKLGKTKNLEIYLTDAFKNHFGDFSHIYVFGMPDKMKDKIVPKFLDEAPIGAKLYSYAFSIPEEYQQNSYSVGNGENLKIHILEKK